MYMKKKTFMRTLFAEKCLVLINYESQHSTYIHILYHFGEYSQKINGISQKG